MNVRTRGKGWLLPTVLILFLLEIVLFPFAAQLTYAGRSESPNHILTYTTGNLVWDDATDIDTATGAAMLDLFSNQYENVQSDNGDSVVAPGTGNTGIVRLKNDVSRTITYVAVLYCVKESETLPIWPVLAENEAFTQLETEGCPLPDGVAESQVVQAVTGTVGDEQIQDFDIAWQWNYYDNDQRDAVDTVLGNKAAFVEPDDVTAGLYIVVEEDGPPAPPIEPDEPDVPDETDKPDEPDESVDIEDPLWPGGGMEGEDTPPDSAGGSSTIEIEQEPAYSGNYTHPTVPYTGGGNHMTLYLVLMGLSAVVLVLLVLDRRRERKV